MDRFFKPTKEQADRCITHHYACDCREYSYQQQIQALQEDISQLKYERAEAGKRVQELKELHTKTVDKLYNVSVKLLSAEEDRDKWRTLIEKYQDRISFALQADLEHGVAWLNDAASQEFSEKYREIRKVLTAFMDVE